MSEVYHEAQRAGIAFALNEDGFVVAYNSREVEDCELYEKNGFEYAETNTMTELFPIWDHTEVYLKRK